MTKILDIYMTNLWSYQRLPHDIHPVVESDVMDWCTEQFGKNRVQTVAREVRVRRWSGMENSHRVFLTFEDEASLVHFRLRWGGTPVEQMPVPRSTIVENQVKPWE